MTAKQPLTTNQRGLILLRNARSVYFAVFFREVVRRPVRAAEDLEVLEDFDVLEVLDDFPVLEVEARPAFPVFRRVGSDMTPH